MQTFFATTDHTGHYVLYNVPDGTTYWVEATAEDYDCIYKAPYFSVNDNLTLPAIELGECERCEGDFDDDGDVDNSDLATFAAGWTTITLEEFATNFGRTNCP